MDKVAKVIGLILIPFFELLLTMAVKGVDFMVRTVISFARTVRTAIQTAFSKHRFKFKGVYYRKMVYSLFFFLKGETK